MPRPLQFPLLQLLLFSSIAVQHGGTAATLTSTAASSRSTDVHLDSTTQRHVADLVNAEEPAGSGWETLETEFKLATHSSSPTATVAATPETTMPTSIEQQDQPPAIPATTLAFAHAVAVAGDTMDSTGFSGDATPPYAAVDDSYGN
ncbi:uncharacterized protein Dvir_GJ26712 [Drosophila virilis]|uniref:Uncharacterized protein n=1 Tax=Drosophila virilis TaxID=7244 RepID=A0A0Q9VZR1_DROVI|nr:uncharacterized protein Dvir_GJ26712 [Drosophila virilis]